MKVMSEKFIKMENFKKTNPEEILGMKELNLPNEIYSEKLRKQNKSTRRKKYLNMNIVHVHIVKYLIPTEREIKNEKSIQKSMGHL